ncbi:MAG: outer membrane lipoprotein-sorting protein [Gammaproteobacteria bacterium]|nr:MAG: outer membrane lipoprotein-sorting protein [Gammaproteobacteria bacterium]
MSKYFKLLCTAIGVMGLVALYEPAALADEALTGAQIVQKCGYKNPGNDARTTLTITLTDSDGNVKKNVYKRFWKDYQGKGGVLDKMLLYTQYPPDNEGTAFMRWSYVREAGKNADQWLYLPVLRKIRRVSVRDPGDSFLGTDLTYADISPRGLDEDAHRILRVDKIDNKEFYVVESTPKEQTPLYSKRVTWYTKSADWNDCVTDRIDYYSKQGGLLKRQHITWQKVKDAWLWKKVVVENLNTRHSSVFEVSDAEVNVGLNDRIFTERQMKRGLPR